MRTRVMTMAAMAAASFALGAQAQTWDESVHGGADAGSLVGTAQLTTGGGPLSAISGVTGVGDEQDLFIINIVDVLNFSAITGVGSHDTQLWLFDMAGHLVAGNDDSVASPSDFGSALFAGPNDDGTPGLTTPGTYVLAVSGWGGGNVGDPIDANNDPLSTQAVFSELTGPDGAGGANPLAGWMAGAETGAYNILLSGVEAVPAPGALALLGLAGLVGARRRRQG